MKRKKRGYIIFIILVVVVLILAGIFFQYQHTSLKRLPDLSEQKYEQVWQGGDIVILKKHIGIVSDRRNKNGVPYVIHHNDPWQKSYEQDILEKRDDIVGHYRWKSKTDS